jgi:catechol 2,3-dioxygenase-like lactoylglutathione lyase family enzyme
MAHIGIVVSNLETSTRFYEMLLGAERKASWESDQLKIVELKVDNQVIELLQHKNPSQRGQIGPIDHLAFWVTDIYWYVAALKQYGITVEDDTPRKSASGLTIMFLRGPDNERIELVER